jgi:hypothetical protein
VLNVGRISHSTLLCVWDEGEYLGGETGFWFAWSESP